MMGSSFLDFVAIHLPHSRRLPSLGSRSQPLGSEWFEQVRTSGDFQIATPACSRSGLQSVLTKKRRKQEVNEAFCIFSFAVG